jgi:ABC-type Fe3+/spermidine/putrescine transport system ATPase subunit
MPFLKVENIEKSFGDRTMLRGVSFQLDAGQTLAILGRSGCGKTTLLKIIAGLLPGNGAVYMEGENIVEKPARLRNIVYLYQEALLFPHLNVWENIAFGLRLRKLPENDIQNRTNAMLVDVGLADYAKAMPEMLSGGQKQRVAFGRALIIQPRLLLLDEPFGALDVETRGQMQQLYKKVAERHRIATVFVTHDLKEAVLMGDQLAYMEQGLLHVYPNVQAFADDERTGMRQERVFWKQWLE